MKWRAVRADAGYLLRHWSRSGQAIVISLIVPLILLGAFGFLFQSDAAVDPPVLYVHDEADTNSSRTMVARLVTDGLVQVRQGAPPGNGVEGWMDREGISGLLTVTVEYATDGAGVGAIRLLVGDHGALDARIVQAAVERVLHETGSDGPAALAVETRPVADATTYRTFLLPGILGLSIALSGISAGFSSMTELRHMGLLQRLAASPLRKSEWLLGRMLGSVGIGLVAATVLVVAAWIMDPGAFRVGVLSLLLIVGGTLVFAGLGTLLGLAVERPEVGAAILNLALLPLVLLSGTFFSLEQLPTVVRPLSVVSPLTHLTEGLRADMLGDLAAGSGAMQSTVIVLFMALLVLVVGTRLIRWTERA